MSRLGPYFLLVDQPDTSDIEAALMGRDIFFDASKETGGNTQTTARGDWVIATGKEALRQAMLRRILTNPGEWQALPNYGVGARIYVKARNTTGNKEALSNRIRSQLLSDSRIQSVDQVVVESIENGLRITVVVTPHGVAITDGPVTATVEVT